MSIAELCRWAQVSRSGFYKYLNRVKVPNNKVMLFLADNYEDYIKAKNAGWKCYCTKEEFNIDEFVKQIEI